MVRGEAQTIYLDAMASWKYSREAWAIVRRYLLLPRNNSAMWRAMLVPVGILRLLVMTNDKKDDYEGSLSLPAK